MAKESTAKELIALLIPGNPGRKFAIYTDEAAIGVWDEKLGLWCPIVAKLIGDNGWAKVDMNLRANQELVWKQDGWTPYEGG